MENPRPRIAEFTFAMKHGMGLGKIMGTIHTYPTMAEANKFAAGNWRKQHISPKLLRFAALLNQRRLG